MDGPLNTPILRAPTMDDGDSTTQHNNEKLLILKVWLTNHGLDSLYDCAQSEWATFCRLDQDEKEKYSAPW